MADIQLNRGTLAEMQVAPNIDGQLMFGHQSGKLSISMDYVEDNQNKRATLKIPNVTLTIAQLTASSWSNGRYSFENTYPSASCDISISPAEDITAAQLKAFGNAQLVADDITNEIIAKGTVPTVNIPIKLEVTSK